MGSRREAGGGWGLEEVDWTQRLGGLGEKGDEFTEDSRRNRTSGLIS
jgi:hypothetical protein